MASFLLLFGGSESCPTEARYQEPLVQARGQAPLCSSRVEGLQCTHVYTESIPRSTFVCVWWGTDYHLLSDL